MISGVYVFLWCCPEKIQPIFKLGMSEDIHRRMAQCATLYNHDLHEVKVLPCEDMKRARQIEASMHAQLSPWREFVNYPGGTECYDSSVYNTAIDILNSIAEVESTSMCQLEWTDEDVQGVLHPDINMHLAQIGEMSKRQRVALNVTQKQLAVSVGVSERTICRLESGGSVTLENALAILAALGVDKEIGIPTINSTRQRATNKIVRPVTARLKLGPS